MEQSEQPQQKKSPIELAFNVVVVLLIAGAIAQVLQIRGLSDRVADLERQLLAQAEAEVTEQLAADMHNNGWNTVIKSGRGGFELTLPDGWGPVVNDKESDFVIMMGMKQPTLATGNKVVVTETEGFGTDAPSLFSVILLNKSEAAPPLAQGAAEEFSIGKGEDEIKGTKYTYIYPKDELSGIGTQRFQGDRDYEYVLPVGDKELRVYYRVYGSDPRNFATTVDEIVQRIVLAK